MTFKEVKDAVVSEQSIFSENQDLCKCVAVKYAVCTYISWSRYAW